MSDQASNFVEPLVAFDGVPVELASALERVEQAIHLYQTLKSRGRILPNSVDALRVELTYHSNAIEGSTLTLRDTQLVLDGLTPANKSLREVYEARNHDRALRTVERWAEERSSREELTERDILEIHALVMADIDHTHAGRFRSERVLIKGTRFVPPSPRRFAELIPLLLQRANASAKHPVIAAAELHYNFVAVHPFNDGNGRTARLLMNYCLLRHNMPITVVSVDRRSEYLSALEEANASRWQPFALFVASCVEQTIAHLIGKAEQ